MITRSNNYSTGYKICMVVKVAKAFYLPPSDLSKRRNDTELYWDIVLVLEERIGYLRQMGRHIPVLLIT